jgi:Spy/CpxP family protein refolding chaperone
MKRTVIAAALVSALVAVPALAQQQGPGMHGGMMGGGMMHGGMMGSGPGMMGGGMMGGPGAGMEGDCHYGGYAALKLTDEQRAKIGDIQRDTWRKRREIASRMHDQDFHMHDIYAAGVDEARARKAFDAMSAAHKEMFEASLEAGKRINAVLTPEQREQLQRGRRGG